MRSSRVFATIVVIAACSAVITSQTPSGHAVFEQALAKERVEGNLPEAIRLYERVVAEFASDRALASRALLQIGLCYEKLGQAGARPAYERLVREYADQVQIAGEAKTRLAALQRDATAPARQSVRDLPNLRWGLDSVSPDGTQALFTDYAKEGNIGIVDLTTGQSRLLTNFDGTSWAELGSWSPDGRHITYWQDSDTPGPALRIVATPDGKTRTTHRWDAAPSGTLFTSDLLPGGSAFAAANKRPDGRWAIGLVAIADGRFAPLRTLGWDFLMRTDRPRVSPDGRFVAFVERRSGLGDIHILSIDGRQPAVRITDHPADDRQPIWSPDGRQLAFLSNRFGSDALWTVTMEDGDAKGEAVKLKDGMNGVQLVDWRRRGLFYEQTEQSWDVFTTPMEPGTTRSIGLPRLVPYTRSGWNLAPAWSPDGKSLAFVSGSFSSPNSRYLVVVPSSGALREFAIPPSPYPIRVSPVDLRWFGNGRGLGFSAEDDKGQDVVWQLSLWNGEWTAIPREGILSWTGIEWNDDGTAFYFARIWKEEGNGIFRRSVESGRDELLYAATPEAGLRSLEISPDRRWLAFEQWVEPKSGVGETKVIVLNLVSGERRTVVSPTPWYESGGETHRLRLSGWSPDGRVVVRHPPSDAGPAKWLVVPLDGGAPQPLSVDVPASTGSANATIVKWSPDGSSIVFVQYRGSGRLLVLENPLADLPAARIGATRR